jgi:hypothetical protein
MTRIAAEDRSPSLCYYYAHLTDRCEAGKTRAAAIWEAHKSDPAFREKKRAITRAWRKLNRSKHRAGCVKWKMENPARWRELQRRQKKKIAAKIASNQRHRLRHLFDNDRASVRVLPNLIGCTPKTLLAHISAQFQPGMAWSNYGAWVVDHRRPVCSFDLHDVDQVRQCFCFLNLQPLWDKENKAKAKEERDLYPQDQAAAGA